MSLVWLVEGVGQLLLLIYHIALNTSKLLLMWHSKVKRHGLILLRIRAVLVGGLRLDLCFRYELHAVFWYLVERLLHYLLRLVSEIVL